MKKKIRSTLSFLGVVVAVLTLLIPAVIVAYHTEDNLYAEGISLEHITVPIDDAGILVKIEIPEGLVRPEDFTLSEKTICTGVEYENKHGGAIVCYTGNGEPKVFESNQFERPAGMEFADPLTLYIADFEKGLMEVKFNISFTEITSIKILDATKGIDDVAIHTSGDVFYTVSLSLGEDAKSKDPVVEEFFIGNICGGKLKVLHPNGKKDVLLDERCFPNGVAFIDGNTLRMAEMWGTRVGDYDLSSGKYSVIVNDLKFQPDNVSVSEHGTTCVGMVEDREDIALLQPRGFLRSALWAIPPFQSWVTSQGNPRGPGGLLLLDEKGNPVHFIFDSTGERLDHPSSGYWISKEQSEVLGISNLVGSKGAYIIGSVENNGDSIRVLILK